MRWKIVLVSGFMCSGFGTSAHAQTAQSTMDVTATVVEACAVTANELAFGDYDPTAAAPTDATSNIIVACTPGTIFVIGLNQGTSSGATITDRRMANGLNFLRYGLFADAARLTNIGATPGVDALPARTSTAVPTVVPVFGRVPAMQKVQPGNYRDVVTVTVTY